MAELKRLQVTVLLHAGLPCGDNCQSAGVVKVTVPGLVASDSRKCLIIFVPDSKWVTVESYQVLVCQHVMPWLSGKYPVCNYVFQQELRAWA
jgi:hypothetical protein